MLDEVSRALATVAPATRKRLEKCLPVLQSVIAAWDGSVPRDGFALAAATPRGGTVLYTHGWPAFDPQAVAKLSRADAVVALINAIEAAPSDDSQGLIVAATYVVLGAAGVSTHAKDVRRIVDHGHVPLTVLLVDKHGSDVSLVATTIALPTVTVH